eukprot:PhF_6_TR16917/c0_g1_i4/m.25406
MFSLTLRLFQPSHTQQCSLDTSTGVLTVTETHHCCMEHKCDKDCVPPPSIRTITIPTDDLAGIVSEVNAIGSFVHNAPPPKGMHMGRDPPPSATLVVTPVSATTAAVVNVKVFGECARGHAVEWEKAFPANTTALVTLLLATTR